MSVAEVRKALAPGVDTFGAIDPSTPLLEGDQPQGIIQQLGGLETFWNNQDRPFVDPESRAWFLLTLNNWRMVQNDELTTRTVQVPVEGGGTQTQIVYGVRGLRQFTLQVRCESMAQDNNAIAFNYLDALMTAMQSQTGRDLFKANNLSFVEFGPNGAVNVDERVDQRWRSHAIVEAEFYTAICVEEEPSNCWIQKAIVSSNLIDLDGEAIPVPPAWKDHVIDGGAPAQT